MKLVRTGSKRYFDILLESGQSQAAIMNLKPGEASGAFGNEHPRAEQWVLILAGHGAVRYGRRKRAVKAGDLILIPQGEPHQIVNDHEQDLLRTLNFYVPRAYTKSGDVRRDARP